MNTAQPIRDLSDLAHFKDYYRKVEPHPRNALLIVFGLNTALRISDLLNIQWKQVYDFERQEFFSHITLVEQKTGKDSCIFLNENIISAIQLYWNELSMHHLPLEPECFLFANNRVNGQAISRVQAFRIIKKAARECQIRGTISCHSLRKTFGYFAWKQGVSPALLMNIYNHSSFQITQRYLGIEQDDRDKVFQMIKL